MHDRKPKKIMVDHHRRNENNEDAHGNPNFELYDSSQSFDETTYVNGTGNQRIIKVNAVKTDALVSDKYSVASPSKKHDDIESKNPPQLNEVKMKPIPTPKKEPKQRTFCCSFFVRAAIFLFVNAALVIITYTTIELLNTNFHHLESTMPPNSNDPSAVKVVLFGDSLINVPFTQFNLGGLLADKLNTYYHHINFYNEGINGQTIHDISLRVNDVIRHKPHAVIIQWDTDVSNLDVTETTDAEQAELKTAYAITLRQVILTLKASGIEYIIISGPILLGEGKTTLRTMFYSKQFILDDYCELNAQIARETNVTYINMRKIFKRHIPVNWISARYYITKDGEHPNRRGTQILADVFGNYLQDWLAKRSVLQSIVRQNITTDSSSRSSNTVVNKMQATTLPILRTTTAAIAVATAAIRTTVSTPDTSTSSIATVPAAISR